MDIVVGTSGFSYAAWKGSFYPEKLPAAGMLRFYAERLPAVEINNTFYRMPSPALLRGWSEEVPRGFRFVLKAPRRITHQVRLGGADRSLEHFLEMASLLGERRGPLLFQLPPSSRKDLGVLKDFLARLRPGVQAAFEFRHPSWHDAEVAGALGGCGAAFCLADTDDRPLGDDQLQAIGRWGYLRLRRLDYSEAELGRWLERISSQPWEEVFVFFKHEERAPVLAAQLLGLVSAAPRRRRRGG